MRKSKLFAAGTLALFLASVGGAGTSSDVLAQGTPTVTPTLTVTTSGNQATFVLMVRNNLTGTWPNGAARNLAVVDYKLRVPDGTTVTNTWAIQGPGRNPGRYTGGDKAIGWVRRGHAAGKTEGPWVMTVDTGGRRVCSFGYVKVSSGEASGEWTTPQVCTGDAPAGGGGTSGGSGGANPTPQPLQPLQGR